MRARRVQAAALAAFAGAVLAAGFVTGCGASAAGSGTTGSARVAATAPATDASADTTTTSTQVVQVTTTQAAASTSTTATTTKPGDGRPVIQLGDMNTNEQFIIGELYEIALKHQGYTVVLSRNIGSTETSQAALAQGSLMLYPQYLNIWNTQVVNAKTQFTSLNAAYESAEGYASKRKWALLLPTAFSNTSGIAVSAQYARLNNVYSLAELGASTSITLGAPLEFAQARTGLPDLESAYGFSPAYIQSIDIGEQYSALTDGAIQASYVDTTDPQLSQSNFVLLRDPQHVFGFGNVVPVTTDKVISEEGPSFVETINRVDQLLSQSAMRGLNYEVTIQNRDPATVAQQFLQGNGIIPPVLYTTTTSTDASAPTPTVAATTTTGTDTVGYRRA